MYSDRVYYCKERLRGSSQGSHFFQNILSFGIGYATVDLSAHSDEVADYSFWDSLPSVNTGQYARHVQARTM